MSPHLLSRQSTQQDTQLGGAGHRHCVAWAELSPTAAWALSPVLCAKEAVVVCDLSCSGAGRCPGADPGIAAGSFQHFRASKAARIPQHLLHACHGAAGSWTTVEWSCSASEDLSPCAF